jgi:hypothetical protein
MDYLVYVAHDAETLQFYLWLQDYTKRYNALRKEEQALSPEWKQTAAMTDAKERKPRTKASMASLSDFDPEKGNGKSMRMSEIVPGARDLFADPPMAAAPATDYESFITRSVQSQKSISEMTDDANAQAGLKWQACMPPTALH